MMAPPPSPPPKGGAWLPRYPYNKGVRFGLSSYWQPHRGNLTFHSPPYGGGAGGGATLSWDRNSAQKGSVNSVSSVREKPPQRKQKKLLRLTQVAQWGPPHIRSPYLKRVSRVIKNPYNPPSWPHSQHADIIAYNRGYNTQEISVLRFAFENMPFLLVEDALLDARRACSWT